VPICQEIFDRTLGDRPNQLDRLREDVSVTADQLLDLGGTPGAVTEAGLRNNASVALQYLASWLDGNGAVAIFNLMEDAATAEIARSQLWQWVHNAVKLDTGAVVTAELVERVLDEELDKIREAAGDAFAAQRFAQARDLVVRVALADDYADFLTLPAYALVVAEE
jgi:malate synthase